MRDNVSLSVIAYASGAQRAPTDRTRIVAMVIAFHPLLLPIALYATWITAYATLGRVPRPSLDDPAQIGGAVDIVGFVAAILIYHWQITTIISIAVLLCLPLAAVTLMRTFLTMTGLYLLTWWLFETDPGSVACWFYD